MKRDFDTINLLKDRYFGTACFYFSLYRYTDPIVFTDNRETSLLDQLLSSDDFAQEHYDFFPLNQSEYEKAIRLDRYELEGSLVSMFLRGTCTERIVADENESRSLVKNLLSELKIDNNDTFAFKLDHSNWSKTAKESTISCFYVIYQSLHRYWILLGFADFY